MFVGVLAALAPGTITIEAGSGNISSNNWTSSTYTTPAGCVTITPLVSLASQRGNGASQYYYRSIKWRVEYWSGSAWVPLAWRTVNMGAQFNAVTDSGDFTFPSAAAWQWRIYAEQYDTDGTVFGSVSYNYAQDVVSGGSQNWTAWRSEPLSVSGTVGFSGYSLPSGWEIYQKAYTWQQSYESWIGSSSDVLYLPRYTIAGQRCDPASQNGASGWDAYTGTLRSADTKDRPTTFARSHTVSGSSLSAALTDLAYSVSMSSAGSTGTTFTGWVESPSVTIYRRQPVANSTTPINNTYINSYDYA